MTVHEPVPEPSNPLELDGIEFIEYATSQPQAFGTLLQQMGFSAVARHRSREVVLYRQGSMNLIVNAHPDALPGLSAPGSTPALAAIALRVRDAAYAHRHALDLGAWDMPTRASAMELNIPGIHGVGDSLIYFVDRYRDFSIYDVDFVPLPGAEAQSPAGTISASCRPSSAIAPPTGSSSTSSCSALRCSLKESSSASCPRALCWKARAASSICSSSSRRRARRTSSGTRACCASAWARPTCAPPSGSFRIAAWSSSTTAPCRLARRARSRRSTWAGSPSSWW